MANFLLKKGGAGVSLSREATVQRLNPIIRQLYALTHVHNALIGTYPDQEAAAQLEAHQKMARADIGKLAESVHSAGGAAYNGTDMEPSDFQSGVDRGEAIRQLIDQEKDFQDALKAEFDVKHQIRTEAVLTKVKADSQARLDYLSTLAKSSPAEVV